jgi:hypothetical protein
MRLPILPNLGTVVPWVGVAINERLRRNEEVRIIGDDLFEALVKRYDRR